MFPCVWLHFKKFSGKYFLVFSVWKRRRKTQVRKHKPQPRKKKSSTTTVPRSRSRIAITPRIGAGARTGARDLGLELELATWTGSSPFARARALSLSLSFSGNALKGKQKCKSISVVKGCFFGSTDFNFEKIEFFGPTKQPHFRKSISGNDFHPKQTQPQIYCFEVMFVFCVDRAFRVDSTCA